MRLLSSHFPYLALSKSGTACLSVALLTSFGSAAQAAKFGIAVAPTQDPIAANLTVPATATTQGLWSAVLNWPAVPIHAAMLPSGLISTYGSATGNAVQDGRTYDVWNPYFAGGNYHTTLPGVSSVNSFCSTSALLAQGSLLISGGIIDPSGTTNNDHGSVLLNAQGTQVSPTSFLTADDRYYSTMIMLASGQPLIMGGTYPYAGSLGIGATTPTLYLQYGYGASMTPEIFSPTTGWKSLFGASSQLAFGPAYDRYWYPRAWQAPNGKVFGISSEQMWFLDPTGNGALASAGTFKTPEVTGTIAASAAPNIGPTSTAVMYDVGKILQVGGNGYYNGDGTISSSLATTFDITGATPVVKETTPMTYGRQWATATVLPTGTVLVTGGSTYADTAGSNAATAPEIWDPATGRWTLGTGEANYRGYHSNATLLQSGAVMTGGGGVPGPSSNMNTQIYYPPYLFTTLNGQAAWAARPYLVSLVSNQLAYAQTTQIEVDKANAISKVVLIGLSEVTHSFNTGQRYIPMAFSQAGTVLSLQTPASANIAPPGYYQLFVVDGGGVPSPGVIVALGAGIAAPPNAMMPVNGASALPPGSWSTCASEGGSCTVAGTQTVAYGIAPTYIQKTVTGTIPCTNAAFGLDPAYGLAKSCTLLAGQVAASGASNPAGSGAGSPTGGSAAAATGGNLTTTGTPTQIGFLARALAAAPDGTTATINSVSGYLWLYRKDNDWGQLTSTQFIDVATLGAGRFYAVGADHNVYRYNGSGWTQVGNNAIAIAASSDGGIAVVNDQTAQVWLKPTDDNQWNWQPITGASARRLAMISKTSLYFVGTDGNVWRSDTKTKPTRIGVNASDISASSDGTVTVVSTAPNWLGTLWRKTGDDTVMNWTLLPYNAVRVATPNASVVLTVRTDGTIARQ